MLSYIGKKKILFCRKLKNAMQKSQEMGNFFVVSIFPVMVPLHSYHVNKKQFPLGLFILW